MPISHRCLTKNLKSAFAPASHELSVSNSMRIFEPSQMPITSFVLFS